MERLIRRDGKVSGASVDTIKNLVWVIAMTRGLLFLIGSRVSTPPKIAARMLSSATAGTAACAANLAVVFYILAHLMDPRWSVGRDATVESPDVCSGPTFQSITDTLNDASVVLVGLAVANRILSSIIERTKGSRLTEIPEIWPASCRTRHGLLPGQDRTAERYFKRALLSPVKPPTIGIRVTARSILHVCSQYPLWKMRTLL
jgi:hypothetical protein